MRNLTFYNIHITFIIFQTDDKTWKVIPTLWRWDPFNTLLCRGFIEAILTLFLPYACIAYLSIRTAIKLLERNKRQLIHFGKDLNPWCFHLSSRIGKNVYLLVRHRLCIAKVLCKFRMALYKMFKPRVDCKQSCFGQLKQHILESLLFRWHS